MRQAIADQPARRQRRGNAEKETVVLVYERPLPENCDIQQASEKQRSQDERREIVREPSRRSSQNRVDQESGQKPDAQGRKQFDLELQNGVEPLQKRRPFRPGAERFEEVAPRVFPK
jgi:hypothetical protein